MDRYGYRYRYYSGYRYRYCSGPSNKTAPSDTLRDTPTRLRIDRIYSNYLTIGDTCMSPKPTPEVTP